MRKIILMLGTILIATILISGPVMAEEIYIARVESSVDCTYPSNAVGIHNDAYATIGENPSTLGLIILDFGLALSMGSDQEFTIYGMSHGETETYDVRVIEQDGTTYADLGSGEDTTDEVFTTPSTSGRDWRWVKITATFGNKGDGDNNYGPEIDAVGYET
jgi:hypothetical protein